MQSAGEAIGLKAKLKSVSAANYINFFIDPEARKGVDGFFTDQLRRLRRPGRAATSRSSLKDGTQNYDGYDNPKRDAAAEAARGEADDTKRAQLVVEAQTIITEQMVVDPDRRADTVLIMNKDDHRRAGVVPVHVRALGCVTSAPPASSETAIGVAAVPRPRGSRCSSCTLLVVELRDLRVAVPRAGQPDRAR